MCKAESEWRADTEAALRWGTGAAVTLLTEHLLLWDQAPHFSGFRRYVPYVVGTATLLAALTGWGQERGQLRAARAAWLIAACGGSVVISAYRLRAARADHIMQHRGLPALPRRLLDASCTRRHAP